MIMMIVVDHFIQMLIMMMMMISADMMMYMALSSQKIPMADGVCIKCKVIKEELSVDKSSSFHLHCMTSNNTKTALYQTSLEAPNRFCLLFILRQVVNLLTAILSLLFLCLFC